MLNFCHLCLAKTSIGGCSFETNFSYTKLAINPFMVKCSVDYFIVKM